MVASVVTSRPVVGSSIINRSGSHARAIAIITRCCIPPLNSWGYLSPTWSASANPTLSNNSTTLLSVSIWSRFKCSEITSFTWSPIFMEGFNDVVGS
jgi:hypothetical protein